MLFIGFTVQAQFMEISLMIPHYYPGEVYFNDGHIETYDEIELPRTGKSKIGVKNNGDKKYHDIDALDIVGIKIWHKDFPDNTHKLYHVYAKKFMGLSANQWGTPIAASSGGVCYQCEMNYQIDKTTGDLLFVKFKGGNGADTPTVYYVWHTGNEQATLFCVNSTIPKRAAEPFKDNQTIYEGIRKGTLNLDDIQYILNEIADDIPAHATNESMPESVTESAVANISAHSLRHSVCIVFPEIADSDKAVLADYSLYLSRAGMTSASHALSTYKSENPFGSGVLVEYNGKKIVLTNLHVVGYAQTATIVFELHNKTVRYTNCRVLSTDKQSDLAAIEIPAESEMIALPLYHGDISDDMAVVAAGFPGLANKPSWQLTRGFISNAHLTSLEDCPAQHIIQHTASIDSGSSGGPLLYKNEDDQYRITGINTWKAFYREGVGLAIGQEDIAAFLANADMTGSKEYRTIDRVKETSGEDWLYMYRQLSDSTRQTIKEANWRLPLDQVVSALDAKDKEVSTNKKSAKKFDRSAARVETNLQHRSHILVRYANYFGYNQKAGIAIEQDWRIGFVTTGMYVDALFANVRVYNDMMIYDNPEDQYSFENRAGAVFGVYLGFQVPITVNKHILVPRITQSAGGGPLKTNDTNGGYVIETDMRAGLDWHIPFSRCDLILGLHYDMNWFWSKDTWSIEPFKKAANSDQHSLFLQHGIGVNLGVGF